MMKKLSVLFLALLFSFCTKKEESDLPKIFFPKVDKSYEVNTKIMLNIYPTPTISFFPKNFDNDIVYNEKLVEKLYNRKFDFFDNSDTIFPKYNIKALLDDSYIIDTKGFEYKNIPIPPKEYIINDGTMNGRTPTQDELNKSTEIINSYCDMRYKQWNDYVKCYPLLVFNNESKNIHIKKMKFIQEAKDKNGQWKPIEFFEEMRSCMVNHHFLRFEKKKYLALPIIKYFGNFKTKLRVKIQINDHFYYSDEFDGAINLSQFDTSYLIDYLKKYDSESFQKTIKYKEEAKPYLLMEL